jgi:hypothetical protein
MKMIFCVGCYVFRIVQLELAMKINKKMYLSPEYFEKIFIRLCVIEKFYVPLYFKIILIIKN